jgi:hypothetical protein
MVREQRETSVVEEPTPKVWEALGDDGMPPGATSVELDGTIPSQAMTPVVRIGAW